MCCYLFIYLFACRHEREEMFAHIQKETVEAQQHFSFSWLQVQTFAYTQKHSEYSGQHSVCCALCSAFTLHRRWIILIKTVPQCNWNCEFRYCHGFQIFHILFLPQFLMLHSDSLCSMSHFALHQLLEFWFYHVMHTMQVDYN